MPGRAATFTLGSVRAWVDDGDSCLLLGSAGCVGRVVREEARATLIVPPEVIKQAVSDVYALLTISSALLIGGLGGALIHAGAVVHPTGGAWLLVGDSHSGKSTTCAGLIRAGWGFLSDDHVVLLPTGAGIELEGWLRPFHLDEGWEAGEIRGRRTTVDPDRLAPGRWRRTGSLAGFLVTEVRPNVPTRLERLARADGLASLIRQSPWLLTDRVSANSGLPFLTSVAAGPCFALRLGKDTYGAPERLSAVLDALPA